MYCIGQKYRILRNRFVMEIISMDPIIKVYVFNTGRSLDLTSDMVDELLTTGVIVPLEYIVPIKYLEIHSFDVGQYD